MEFPSFKLLACWNLEIDLKFHKRAPNYVAMCGRICKSGTHPEAVDLVVILLVTFLDFDEFGLFLGVWWSAGSAGAEIYRIITEPDGSARAR